jgi:hypothetical protein
MTDQYEIVRSVDSKEYNYLEYNGRYAILCAPIRDNKDNQFKYDITQMRYYLIANGWSDSDIIFLTCKDHAGRDNLTPNIAELYNGTWIDGEAYHDNLGNAFEALRAGGSFLLEQSDGTNISYSFAQASNRDTVFIELNDHGSINYTSTHYFCTYIPTDYNLTQFDSFWSVGDVDASLDNISAYHMIILLDMCHAGGWIYTILNETIIGDNRIILMSQDDTIADYYGYMFYARIWGDIIASFSLETGWIYSETGHDWDGTYPGNNETMNADGATGINYTTNSTGEVRTLNRTQNQPWNSIISVQEAHYFADCICNKRFQFLYNGHYAQNPQIWIDNLISISAPSLYI